MAAERKPFDMGMHRLIAALALVLIPTVPALAQWNVSRVSTGITPAALFSDSQDRVHVLCAGVDRATYGVFEPDSGDVSASWFVMSRTGELLDSLTFNCHFSSFPVRVAVDPEGVLYVAQLGRVRAFSTIDRSLLRDTVVLGDYSGVSWDARDRTLLLHARPGFTTRGSVLRYDPATDDTLSVVEAGVNPQMSVSLVGSQTGATEVYTMSEGLFGAPTSLLTWTSSVDDAFQRVNGEPLGYFGTQMISDSTHLYIAMAGTHQVRVVEARGFAEAPISPINVGTVGLGGPRTLALQGDSVLVVGTYSGDLRRFDLATGEMIDSIPMPGRVESVVVGGDTMAFAAIRYGGATFALDSVVVAVNLVTGTVVDTVVVGVAPSILAIDKRGDLHVFGRGGDAANSWWKVYDVYPNSLVFKSSTSLQDTLPFVASISYDANTNELFLPFGKTIKALSPAEGVVTVAYGDSTLAGQFTSAIPLGAYLIATSWPADSALTAGTVHIVRRSDKRRVAMSRTGRQPIMALPVAAAREPSGRIMAIATLNVGGSGAATLSSFAYSRDILVDTLGSGANHLLVDGETLVVTLNGSHQLAVVDPEEWRVRHRIATGTNGYDGPREAARALPGQTGASYATVTYAGDLRFALASADSVRSNQVVPTGGKAESVLPAGDRYFVAIATSPAYAPDSIVAIVSRSSSTRLSDLADMTMSPAHPNPARDRTRMVLRFAKPTHARLELVSTDGALTRAVLDEILDGDTALEIATDDLPAGAYLLVLNAAGRVRVTRLEVVR